jgi:hypothetical protein
METSHGSFHFPDEPHRELAINTGPTRPMHKNIMVRVWFRCHTTCRTRRILVLRRTARSGTSPYILASKVKGPPMGSSGLDVFPTSSAVPIASALHSGYVLYDPDRCRHCPPLKQLYPFPATSAFRRRLNYLNCNASKIHPSCGGSIRRNNSQSWFRCKDSDTSS